MALIKRICALAALALPLTAQADPDRTHLTLSATGHASGTPSIITAIFNMQKMALTPAAAQSQLNALADKSGEAAGNASSVKLSFRDYDTWQEEKKDGSKQWGARQKLVLTGHDSKALLDVVGRLQRLDLALDGLSWSMAPAERRKLEQDAQTDALNQIKSDAEHIAQTLGMHVGPFHKIDVTGRYTPIPSMTMLRAASSSVPQRSDDDAQDVSVQVTANLYLTP